MRRKKKCRFCRRWHRPHPQTHYEQKTCGRQTCRAQRKRHARKRWRLKNPHYDDGREEELKAWRVSHPGYQRSYRARHPAYVQRNRRLQAERDRKRRFLVKQDAWSSLHAEKIKRIRRLGLLVKQDACRVSLTRQTEEICRYLEWRWLLVKQDAIDRV